MGCDKADPARAFVWQARRGSSDDDAQNLRNEFVGEKVHPAALAIPEGHALEVHALNLHRQTGGGQWPVLGLRVLYGFLGHVGQPKITVNPEYPNGISIYLGRLFPPNPHCACRLREGRK